MTTQIDRARIPGTPEYFHARAAAFALIREVEAADCAARNAPTYVRGGWDEDYGDYEPVENLGPYDRADAVAKRAKGNLVVVEILKAQNRLALVGMSDLEAASLLSGQPAVELGSTTILVPWQGLTYSAPCAYQHRFDVELVKEPGRNVYALTLTTHYWGVRPGKPGKWSERVTEGFAERTAAMARYDRRLAECRAFSATVKSRYQKAA